MIEIIPDFKCSAPWEGVFINPDGDFRFCCAGQKGSIGNLNKNTLQELIDGPVKRVQDDILTKGHSDYCTNCMESEQKSGRSLRESFTQDFTKFDTTKFVARQLDVRWRNTCHLRCGYCNSEWSSAFAQWEGKNYKVSETSWQKDVLEFLRENSDMQVVNFLGGEPLLLKENVDLIDLMPRRIHGGVVTNLSIENIETLPVYQKLLNRRTSWLVSLEATGNKFEYIRRNAKWELTSENYKNLHKNLNPESNLGIHMTYCIQSAFSLVETFDWLFSVDPNPVNNFSFPSLLLGPKQFSIYIFPKEIKELAIQEFDLLMEKHGDYINQRTKDFVINTRQSLVDTMDEMDLQHLDIFKEYIKKTDNEINPITFAKEWPEVYEILEKY
jgi:organic radical activating enzyme